MRITRIADAPRWHVHWWNLSLAVLHFVVFFHAAIFTPIVTTKVATRALP